MRRGLGSDVAGARPYQPGDDVDKIDWYASARLSLARGSEEFVVREHFADEAPRVVVLCDRRPSMSVFPDGWPWLAKPEAIRNAVSLIGASATAARGLLGYFDEAEGDAYWHPPRSSHAFGRPELDRGFGAPDDTLRRGLRHLAEHKRDLPAGTFVFVVSDFLAPPTRDEWLDALERRFEIIPVIVQDPLWEQSFPDVSGVAVPYVGLGGEGATLVSLTAREVRALREVNETRWSELLRSLRALDMDPVVVDSHESRDVVSAFLGWADQRMFTRGRA
jgi:uncharacterized protein (DUF58 family)